MYPQGRCGSHQTDLWLLQVKQQHIDNNTQFLADELQVVDRREAKDRVFFVSAREALVSRLQNDTGVPTPGMYSTLHLVFCFSR